jgi:hypothetical protein
MLTDKQFLSKLSASLFWDVDRNSIDAKANAAFLIVRVMERGTRQEVLTAWSYYGAAHIKDVLTGAPSLSPKTIAFFANQFGIKRKAFRAYQRTNYWTY